MIVNRPTKNLELIGRVLGESEIHLTLERIVVDDVPDAQTKVTVHATDGSQSFEVEGEGQGIVDALFAALSKRFAMEYSSLETIELAGFSVSAKLETKRQDRGGDAEVAVVVDVKNHQGQLFTFSDASRSMVASAACAVLAMVEYFVNAERAFLMLYHARQDAKDRNREDLVTRYTSELAEVVKSTSYTKVIERMMADLKKS